MKKRLLFIFQLILLVSNTVLAQQYAAKDTFPRITITDTRKPNYSDSIIKVFTWQHEAKIWSVQLKLSQTAYNYYKTQSKNLPYERYAEDYPQFRYFKYLCVQLDKEAQKMGYDGIDLVNFITSFVQNGIPYKSDIGEYKKYPIETLMENGGDCEDKSALLCALLNTFGFDACMVLLPGHMVVGISCTNCDGYYNYAGKKFSFIESTAGGWKIGQVLEAFRTANATILEVTHTDYYQRPVPQYAQDWDRPNKQRKDLPGNTPPPLPYYDKNPDPPFIEPVPQSGWGPPPTVPPVPVYIPQNTVFYPPLLTYNSPPQPYAPQIPHPVQYIPLGNGGRIILFGQEIIHWYRQ